MDIDFVERSQIQSLINEQDLVGTRRMDRESMARIGKILGVQALVIGQIKITDVPGSGSRVGFFADSKRCQMSVKIVNVETGSIILHMETNPAPYAANYPCPQDEIHSICRQIRSLD